MKSPFRRRRRPKGRRMARSKAFQPEAKAREPEVIDWPKDGTGRSMMAALRGDADGGAGFASGMFADLHAAFSGAKRIQIEVEESEKMRRADDLHQEGAPRDDLDSGVIRIRRAAPEKD
ncbi:MAG: DUF6191 domain-containing protein [Actinomadura sp.]